MSTRGRILVYPDPAALAQAAARLVVEGAQDAVQQRGAFRIALSGGSTPQATYRTLAEPACRDRIDWQHMQVFFSDERFVPPDSPDSDYGMARKSLLAHVPLPDGAVHPVPTVGLEPAEAAARYSQTICDTFGVQAGGTPQFDVILLGMGDDGHTASLFPGTTALLDDRSLVAANYVEKFDAWRVTFTYPLIDAARCVAFLVEGSGKAETLARVLSGENLPAARVNPGNGQLLWLIDEAAASQLPADAHPERP